MQAAEQTTRSQALAVPGRSVRSLLRHTCVGVAGTGIHYVLMFLLLDVIGSPVESSTIGAVIGALVSFRLARHRVFVGRCGPDMSLPRFVVVAAIALGVNAAILSLMVLSLSVLSSQVVATGCALLAGYVVNSVRFRQMNTRTSGS